MKQKLIRNHDDTLDTHYFIYSKKELNRIYPIKIEFFKISSKKFSNNQVCINSDKSIYLFDNEAEENFKYSDDSIHNFINYVHRQDAFLNNNNVTEINYLAIKYEVFSLIEATKEYINEHKQELNMNSYEDNVSDKK